MAYDTILYEVRERICTITLNRPEHMNSYNSQMCQEINLALDAADSDDDVRVVIFTGAEGGKRPAYCAGFDLTVDKPFDFSEAGFHNTRDTGGTNALRIYAMRKPVLAAINGSAVGIGITMTLPMDMRILSEDAKLGFVFARRGYVNEACSSWFLPRIVGLSKAVEWVTTGRIIGAEEALHSGLVSEVVPHSRVYARALEVARDIPGQHRPCFRGSLPPDDVSDGGRPAPDDRSQDRVLLLLLYRNCSGRSGRRGLFYGEETAGIQDEPRNRYAPRIPLVP